MNRDILTGVALGQAILYTLIYLYDDYIGLLLAISISLIVFSIFLISFISDRLEYANVAKWYYPFLGISIFVPLLISGLFYLFKAGNMDWMKPLF